MTSLELQVLPNLLREESLQVEMMASVAVISLVLQLVVRRIRVAREDSVVVTETVAAVALALTEMPTQPDATLVAVLLLLATTMPSPKVVLPVEVAVVQEVEPAVEAVTVVAEEVETQVVTAA